MTWESDRKVFQKCIIYGFNFYFLSKLLIAVQNRFRNIYNSSVCSLSRVQLICVQLVYFHSDHS